MDKKAMYKLSYGLFVLTAKRGQQGQWLYYQHRNPGGI